MEYRIETGTYGRESTHAAYRSTAALASLARHPWHTQARNVDQWGENRDLIASDFDDVVPEAHTRLSATSGGCQAQPPL